MVMAMFRVIRLFKNFVVSKLLLEIDPMVEMMRVLVGKAPFMISNLGVSDHTLVSLRSKETKILSKENVTKIELVCWWIKSIA